MTWFVAKALIAAVVSLLVAAALVFLLFAAASGQLAGPAEANAAFWQWIAAWLTGDFGQSAAQTEPVARVVAERLAVTVPLVVLAAIVAGATGIGIGYLAARRGGASDRILTGMSRAAAALPGLWFGLMLILIFSVALHWLPAGGFVAWSSNPGPGLISLMLPALALGLPAGASIAAVLRDAIVEARRSGYVRAAKARGLTAEQALWRHGARNAASRLLAGTGSILASLLMGSIIVESVFHLPGIGRLLLDAAAARDAVVVRAAMIVVFLGLLVISVAVRIGRGLIDPRIRRGTLL